MAQDKLTELIQALKAKRQAKADGKTLTKGDVAEVQRLESELADELVAKAHTVVDEFGHIYQVQDLRVAVVDQLNGLKETYEGAAFVDYLESEGVLDELDQETAAWVLGHIAKGQHLALKILLGKVRAEDDEK